MSTRKFMSVDELKSKLNGKPKHLFITGKAGVGKTVLAKNFFNEFSNDIHYYGAGSGITEVSLAEELNLLRELAEERSSIKGEHHVKAVIIDEAHVHSMLSHTHKEGINSNLSKILELGESVNIFVALITQKEDLLTMIDKKNLDKFERINLNLIEDDMSGMYRHYKGGKYSVTEAGEHTETGESLVIYKDKDGKVLIRPLDMFLGEVEVDGEKVPRFRKL